MKLLYHSYFSPVLLFLCLLGMNPQLYASSGPDTLAITGKAVYPVNNYLHWIETKDRLSADEAYQLLKNTKGQLLAPQSSINSGFDDYYYWLSFNLKNTSASEKSVFYKFNYPFLNNIEVYKHTDSGFEKLFKTGADSGFNTRIYPYHDFVFPIRLRAGESGSFLIMAERKGERFSTTPELISDKLFKEKEQQLYIIIGIIAGMMLFNIIINLFLGVSLGDKIHYLYAAYVMSALLWVLSSVGADYQFLFPDYPAVFGISQFVAGGITMVLMAQLAIVFLELRNSNTKSYYYLNLCKWVLLFALIFRIGFYILFPKQEWANKIIGNVYLAAITGIAVSIIWAAAVRIQQGFKPAWFYLAAISFLAVSIFKTSYVILTTNDLSVLVSPPTIIQIGLIIESLTIFAGIIYKYAILKKEKKELAIRLADQKLEMTQNVVAAQEEERKRLAQDLHDDLGATLSTLLLHITNQHDFSHEHYDKRSVEITQKALADLRSISHDLLPKDFSNIHLFQALKNRIAELNNIEPTRFWLSTDGDDKQLSEIQALTIYRIVNELMNNTIKHAKASQANIDMIIVEENITLIYEDNGIGFSERGDEKGIGIRNIHSRVAFLEGEVNTDYNRQGTTVIIVIPLKKYKTDE
ncbi:sensor histidine kinase [Elizabethkingia meningoseptica]|uniref:sensor histidine kinase n=2 Tax=Elizabethkingia meningoseptica TaxID=238 RepID=UPI000B2D6C51|nr:7TM diverse intracellular signaling domain-containing protein [Elizabethkingia meningoseptica]SQG08477.1 Oxygen sensor histidine kinase nreB [Elizabethkingia meningoseptica]